MTIVQLPSNFKEFEALNRSFDLLGFLGLELSFSRNELYLVPKFLGGFTFERMVIDGSSKKPTGHSYQQHIVPWNKSGKSAGNLSMNEVFSKER